jgi:hypothetical protein
MNDNLNILNSLYHNIIHNQHHNIFITKKNWTFYDIHNNLKYLQYEYKQHIETKHIFYDKFTLHQYDNLLIETINPIDLNEFLTQNLVLLQQSHDNYINSISIINYITQELGNYTYSNLYEIGWSIPHFYNLRIDLFSSQISLFFHNKTTNLTQKNLEEFINTNKHTIQNQYNQNTNKESDTNTNTDTNTDTNTHTNTDTNTDTNTNDTLLDDKYLYIKKTLKERYLIQACKPLPITYDWEL